MNAKKITMTTHTAAIGAPYPVRLLSYLLSVLLMTQPVLPAYAAGVSVAGGNTNVDRAANGVPVVDIATPNQAGVSHNKFNDFNVGKEGLILNNATGRLTQTQLGGLIQNNANLKAGQEAKGIINEVVGNNRSQLQGYMEVGGKAASVMVANPYGITCDGCGFINTPNATLTTGKPVLGADGSLQALDVSRGTITVAGQGLNAAGSSALNLISRATEINAGIHAQDLTVIAGANRVDKDGRITALAEAGEKPQVAIDTGRLGGMYANRIKLVSSGQGMGVNLSDVNARQGDIILDVNGDLRMKDSLAAGQLNVNAQNLALSGSHRAEQGMRLTGRGNTAVNDALLSSGKDVSLSSGGQLTVGNSRVQAGADGKGNLNGGGMLTARSATQQWNTSQLEADNITLNATQSLAQDKNSQTTALTDLAIQGGDLRLNGKNGAGRDATLSGKTLTTEAGSQLTAQRDIRAQLSGDAALAGKANAGQDLTLAANTLSSGGELTANRNASLTAQSLDNSGLIQARGDQAINAKTVANRDRIQAGGRLSVTAGSLSTAGLLGGQGGLSLKVTDLLNADASGELFSGADLDITANRFLLAGVVSAQGVMTLGVNELTTGARSQLLSGGDMRLKAGKASLDGLLATDGALGLTTAALTSAATAQTQAQRGLSLDIAGHGDLNGVFTTLGDLVLSAGTLTHNAKSAGANVRVTADSIAHGGLLQADKQLTLNAGGLSVAQGASVLAQQTAQLTVNELDNRGTLAAQRLDINAAARLNNQDGLLNAGGDMRLATARMDNGGKIAAGGGLMLDAATLTNNGLLQAGSNLNLTLSGKLDNQAQGALLAADTLTLKTAQLINAGAIQGQTAHVNAASLTNTGTLMGIGGLALSAWSQLANGGKLLSEGNLSLSAAALTNSGQLLAGKNLTLNLTEQAINSGAMQGERLTLEANTLDNRGDLIGADGLTLTLRQALTNTATGRILTQGDAQATAATVSDSGLWQADSLRLKAGSAQLDGVMQTAALLQLDIENALRTGGNLTSSGALNIAAASVDNRGSLQANTTGLTTGALTNAGRLSGVEALTLTLNDFVQQATGETLSAGALKLNTQGFDNAGRVQGADTQLTMNAGRNSGTVQGTLLTFNGQGDFTNTGDGALLATDTLRLSALGLFNAGLIQGNNGAALTLANPFTNDGRLLSGGDIRLAASQMTNNGTVQGDNLSLTAAALTNTGTWLAANDSVFSLSQLTNSGLLQGATLNLDIPALDNSGTLFATRGLSVTGDSLANRQGGKLYSGGDMSLTVNRFTSAGESVALGGLTLTLSQALQNSGVLAAGKLLAVNTQGGLANSGTMQGQGMQLTSAGVFTNRGTLTGGSQAVAITAQDIALTADGSLQSGGDVQLTSRANIANAGFTGTAGDLALTAAGTLTNTALLYAAGDMRLFADSIANLKGDILAGNSLWLQKDATGNANRSVLNSSGTIETQGGDITVRTGSLVNTREGLKVDSVYTEYLSPEKPYVDVKFVDMNVDDLGFSMDEKCASDDVCHYEYSLSFRKKQDEKTFLVGESEISVKASGGAGRIASGRDMHVTASTLENNASELLANGSMALYGDSLNNNSAIAGKQSVYQLYRYDCQYGCLNYYLGFVEFGSRPFGREDPITYEDILRWDDRAKERYARYELSGAPVYENSTGDTIYRSVIQAGGNLSANFTQDISNTTTTANAGSISHQLSAPALNTLKSPDAEKGAQSQSLADSAGAAVETPVWRDQVQDALKDLGNHGAQLDYYPLPNGNSGLFVTSPDPDSPYLITTNPKLDGLGQIDDSLFNGLYGMLGLKPGAAPRETGGQYTNEKSFLGSSYFMDRLNLNPDYDYRFLGDAAFDTRYVSTAMLQQTGSRYINGVGSELEQMQYLINSAAQQQASLGLQFGASLSAEQVASLTKSIVWWEPVTINGQTVMAPKLYLAPADVTINNGSVISGNNVELAGGSVTNSGSSIAAKNDLWLDSDSEFNNLNGGMLTAGNELDLSAIGDINNIGSAISGNRVALESFDGSIINQTLTQQWSANGYDSYQRRAVSLSETQVGDTASVQAKENLSLNAGSDVVITGAKVAAGRDMQIAAGNDIRIVSNDITQSRSNSGRGENRQSSGVKAQSAQVSAGGNLTAQAGQDITLKASNLSAGEDAALVAGRDVNLQTAEKSTTTRNNGTLTINEDHTRSTLTSGENLTVSAGRDLNSDAAAIVAGESAGLMAGRDVNLNAAQRREYSEYKGGRKQEVNEAVRQQGTEIASGADTTIVSGRDINTKAAQVEAGSDIALSAGRDVNLSTATESDYHFFEETKVKKSLTSRAKTHTVQEDYATREAGTLLSGDNVKVSAGNDLKVTGSQVVGDGQVALNAGNNVTIEAATEEQSHYYKQEKKKSGLFSGGGLGFTIGTSSSRHQVNEDGTTQSQSASTVGSTGGDVSITAGNRAQVSGSDLIANKNLSVTGDSVVIDPGHDVYRRDETFEQKTSGLTVALSGAAGGALNTAVSTAQDAKKQSDGRLAALTGTKAALSGVQAGQAVALAAAEGKDKKNAFGIGASLGSQKSSSESHQRSDTVSGSTLSAGNNLSVTATGKGNGASSGDILIGGSQLKAGGDTTLNAARDVVLAGAANTRENTGKNSSSGFSVGADFSLGADTGFAVSANANKGKGSEKGSGTQWTETTVDSGKTVNIISGRDTTLAGAQVSGEKVVADVGRDLTLSSRQDSDYYDAKQSSVSGGISVPVGGKTAGGGLQLSVSRDKLHSNYDSVQEQTGIYAGKGGFDITVGKHTQLDGAVIAGTADPGKNRLDTGTLGFSDIENKADFKTEHQGGSFSTGGGILGNALSNSGNLSAIGGNNEGHASGTTRSAVSGGSVVIRDEGAQKQDVASLSRDTENANGSIGPIFDKEKEQNRLKEIQLIGEIGAQVGDVIRTQGEIETAKALGDPKAQQAAREALAGLGKLNPTEKEINEQIGRTVMETYGTGGSLQKAAQAMTGILTGLAGGDISKALAGGASPYIAEQIKKYTGDNDAANVMAHAVWGAIAAEVNGNSGLAGAAGVAGGELAARYLAEKLYPGVDPSQYTESQKQTISALGMLAAGMAGGITGDSSANALAGAQAGQNAINNNLIGGNDETQTKFVQEHGKDVLSCATNPGGAACQRGEAVNKAIAGALAGGAAGGALAAATPGMIAAAQAAATACGANPPLCAVQVSNWVVETLGAEAAPVGIAITGVGKLSPAQLSELSAVISMEKQLGSKATKEILLERLPSPGNISTPTSGIGASSVFKINNSQIGKKLGKHVEDFGGDASNAADRKMVLDKINDIGHKPEKIIPGTFSGQGVNGSRGDVFFRIKGNDVVVTKLDGTFVTILKDGVTNNTSVKNALKGNP